MKDENCEFETYWTEVIIDSQPNRLIGVLYRHPSKKNDQRCIESLNETLSRIRKENKKVFLAGDFNYDLLKHESNDKVGNFLQMMLDNSYQPCITEPTRIINKSNPSLIDNIFSNSVEACISGNLFEKITDHMPSFVIVENVKTRTKPKQVKRRNMKNSDPLHYQADLYLLLQLLRENSHPDDAESAYLIFHDKHNAILNKHYPFEVLTKNRLNWNLNHGSPKE